MGGAFPDAAVGDGFPAAVNAATAVKFGQFVGRFEGAILADGLPPGYVGGAGDVSVALGTLLGHIGRSVEGAGEFVGRADIHQGMAAAVDGLQHIIPQGAQFGVFGGDAVLRGGVLGNLSDQGPVFGKPQHAPAVHQADILVSVVAELPERPGGEPVVVVAIEDDGGIRRDAAAAEQGFHLVAGNDVADDVMLQLALPVPGDGAGDVALLVGGGVHVHLHQPDAGVAAVFGHPLGGYQGFGMRVFGHCCTSLGIGGLRQALTGGIIHYRAGA